MPMKNLIHLMPEGDGGSGDGGSGGDGGDGAGSGGNGSQEDNGDGGSGSGGDGKPDPELKRARDEAAKFRRELRESQKRVEELEGAGKTEVEKLTTNVTSVTQERDTALTRVRELTVQVVAGRVGIAQEARADAARLLPTDAVSDWEDEAQVEAALRELVKTKPYLVGKTAGGGDGGEGGNRDEPMDMNARIREAAGRG